MTIPLALLIISLWFNVGFLVTVRVYQFEGTKPTLNKRADWFVYALEVFLWPLSILYIFIRLDGE